MIGDEATRVLVDRALPLVSAGSVTTWTLAEAAHFANDLIPLLTVGVLVLTIVWALWRMSDRWRFGPPQERDDDE